MGFMNEDAVACLAWSGIIVAIDYIVLVLAVLVDLRSGTMRALRRGERRTSRGYRRTVEKVSRYMVTLLACTLVDVILVLSAVFLRYDMGVHIPVFPLLTTLGALAMSLIEVKSVMENSQSKDDYTELVRELNRLLSDKDVRAVIDKFRSSAAG